MRYLMMIYYDESEHPGDGSRDQETRWKQYNAFTKRVIDQGAYRGADALHPVATATTVRVRRGRCSRHRWPYAEAKEQLGGFYVIECDDLDEAIQIAAQCPGSQHGTVELRPVLERGVAATQALRNQHDAPGHS